MNISKLSRVLLMPHISEKSVMLGEKYKQQTFKVQADASKEEVKEAVEKLFDVQVEKVRLVKVSGKKKAFGRVVGKRKNWKKAYITLKEGKEIDLGISN